MSIPLEKHLVIMLEKVNVVNFLIFDFFTIKTHVFQMLSDDYNINAFSFLKIYFLLIIFVGHTMAFIVNMVRQKLF